MPVLKFKELFGIGLMSGSSLDGLDIAFCRLYPGDSNPLEYDLLAYHTQPLPDPLRMRLKESGNLDILGLCLLDQELGAFMATAVLDFKEKTRVNKLDYLANHGHTICHRPDKGITLQIGNSQLLAKKVGVPVIANFRQGDIALGGQGAPLAPIVESWLFKGHQCFLNLGGIANLSFHGARRIAYDITYCNQLLNLLADEKGLAYDPEGQLAASGLVHESLLNQLLDWEYLDHDWPKSLDNATLMQDIAPLFRTIDISVEDKLRTAIEWIVLAIGDAMAGIRQEDDCDNSNIFVTGGGAFNSFLMYQLGEKVSVHEMKTFIPEWPIVEYKEAILMVLLGYLRLHQIPNSWAEVTGASRDNVNGAIYSHI